MPISNNIREFLSTIPRDVQVLAATKSISIEEIRELISGGIKIIGENYLQEARQKFRELKALVSFHLIGHLQNNKVRYAVDIFDMIQSVDSINIANEINKRAKKPMPVLIEVNIGYERNKTGIYPDEIMKFLISINSLEKLQVKGLMTMAPLLNNPEDYRTYFKNMKGLFEEIKSKKIPNISMDILSMGMSENYKIAIDEGANMVRLGRVLSKLCRHT